MAEGDTAINALIGAVLSTVLTGLVPFAPVLGGAVAGYLQGGDRSDGLRVGLYAGLIAFIPAFLLMMIVGTAFLGAMGLGGVPAIGGLGVLILGFVFFFVAIYVVGLSAVGGWLGNYVKHDTDVDI